MIYVTSIVRSDENMFSSFIEPQCPEIRCQIFCEQYAMDPMTGCQICECKGNRTCIHVMRHRLF